MMLKYDKTISAFEIPSSNFYTAWYTLVMQQYLWNEWAGKGEVRKMKTALKKKLYKRINIKSKCVKILCDVLINEESSKILQLVQKGTQEPYI